MVSNYWGLPGSRCFDSLSAGNSCQGIHTLPYGSLKRKVYKKQNPEVCLTTGTTGDYFANIRDFSYICK